ncbi:MAG: Asp-tRNA(Asn)/Glu-tRNA(Gln) amidotransferase subunit GatA [Pseudomonadota bacterium]
MTHELCKKTLAELAELLQARKISSREISQIYLDEIDKRDKDINSYISVCHKEALAQADEADKRLANNKDITPLTGIPIALKDIFITEGIKTTCGSKILGNYIPPFDGTATSKLKDAGAVILGKLNMDEFAMGSSNEFSAFGAVKNPWNPEYTPGGSSGGSAAAVAAHLATATYGTDTGGSIRQPCSFCNMVGLKPTYGRVSRYGIIAFASSLDQLGPMTRDVRDCAIALGVVSGFDPSDSTSIPAPVPDYEKALTGKIKGLTIGLPKEYFISGIDPDVEDRVRKASHVLEENGAHVVEISLPHTKYAVACYYIIAPAEASANLARYDGIRFGYRAKGMMDLADLFEASRTQGFGPEVTLRIIVGTYVLSSGYYDAYYLKAQKVRTLIKMDFLEAFEKCDAILAPVAPTPPFKLGEKTDDPIKMYLNDIFTIPINLAGLPGLSVPCGFSKSGLPIGMQLIGKPLDESTLLNIAYTYEQATEWHKKAPDMSSQGG